MSGGLLNGKFDKQRDLISRHFDKVVLARILFVVIAFQFAMMIFLLMRFEGTESINRVLGIITDFTGAMNNAITTVIGFIGGVITGLSMGSRAADKPTPPSPPGGTDASPSSPTTVAT